MTYLPSITQVITTYFPPEDVEKKRLNVAIDTRRSWKRYLKYNPNIVRLVVVDDGSNEETLDSYLETFIEKPIYFQNKRQGVGASLNRGFDFGFHFSPIIAAFMDDWSLTQQLDLTPYVKLLVEREDVGVVRLGPPHPSTSGKIEMVTEDWQGWALRLNREGFAFGHRPALYHQRFINYYGKFEENVSALECERLYNEKFCNDPNGPDVVLALPHAWQHLDSPSLSALEPK